MAITTTQKKKRKRKKKKKNDEYKKVTHCQVNPPAMPSRRRSFKLRCLDGKEEDEESVCVVIIVVALVALVIVVIVVVTVVTATVTDDDSSVLIGVLPGLSDAAPPSDTPGNNDIFVIRIIFVNCLAQTNYPISIESDPTRSFSSYTRLPSFRHY